LRHYRSEGERNLWHAAAESWRDAGRTYLDEARFLGPRRWWPWPAPVLVALAGGLALLAWRLLVGG
jgi:hypothetical protein